MLGGANQDIGIGDPRNDQTTLPSLPSDTTTTPTIQSSSQLTTTEGQTRTPAPPPTTTTTQTKQDSHEKITKESSPSLSVQSEFASASASASESESFVHTDPEVSGSQSALGRTATSNNTSTSTSTNKTSDQGMKLVVRSPYWGRVLRGKTRRDYDSGMPYRVIGCQAVLSAVDGQYWGCCPLHGKRVLELKEHHFADHSTGDWDLYMCGASVAPNYVVHAYFLLPQDQTLVDIDSKVTTEGWKYVGTASSSILRMDLEAMLSDVLKQNQNIGYLFHHVHIEILMEQVFDRETPRSRKAAIDKSKAERGHGCSNSSIVTRQSHHSAIDNDNASVSTEAQISTGGDILRIPQVVSRRSGHNNEDADENDPQCFSENRSPYSHRDDRTSPDQHQYHQMQYPQMHQHRYDTHVYQAGWGAHSINYTQQSYMPVMYPLQPLQPLQPQLGQLQEYWVPASSNPTAAPPILPPMTPIQQMLHQGYVGNNAGQSAYLAGDVYSSYPLPSGMGYDAPSFSQDQNETSNPHTGAEDPANGDEKYSEDVATASFSDSSREDERDDPDSNREELLSMELR